MKLTRTPATLFVSLLLPILSACGGGTSSPTSNTALNKSDPTPVPGASYDVRKAVLELYGKPHSWTMKGTACCASGDVLASLTLQPRPSDGASVTFGGEEVSGTDITLQLQILLGDTQPSRSTAHLWYSAKGQQMLLNGLVENRMEVLTSQGNLPTSAIPGESGGNGETATFETTATGPRTISTTSYRWELKKDSSARVLMCLNSVETPDPAYAGSNPALAAKTTRSYCYGLNADSTLSGYVTASQHGYTNLGWDIATQ
ncbi:hypothetical protein ACFFKC_06505 [Pseudoduganella danionis]|uniref:Lipoprotein n=1 Tax=Pseudoduganella danionis TaxID=1890295 RepID=A0ABW9SR98_9BURK|nr:hypothetical protein [Pseudoduganella danionis]MTW34144.1 hypothetical protein [Pseudoduganella danionis]